MQYLSLAGLNFRLEMSERFQPDEKMAPFLEENNGDLSSDGTIRLSNVEFINRPEVLSSTVEVDGQRRVYDGRNLLIYYLNASSGDVEFVTRLFDKNVYMEYRSDLFHYELSELPHLFLRMISAETLFLNNNRFILHSSFIAFNNQAILFSAPSETGKSTQAELWKENKKAKVINGDRAGVVVEDDDRVFAYGLPFAGTSRIYINEGYPVKAIIILKQSKINEIEQLSPVDALKALWPEVNIPRFDDRMNEKALSLLTKTIAKVPVYMLKCRPDKDAVDLLYETLFSEEQ